MKTYVSKMNSSSPSLKPMCDDVREGSSYSFLRGTKLLQVKRNSNSCFKSTELRYQEDL